ncbi:MAG: hypothetical protein WBW33_06350 [Bryobacteraceae bacterium]
MIPTNNFFVGGGASETALTPVAAALLALAVLAMWLAPRRYALVPLLLGAFLVPAGEVVVLAGAHLGPVRLLALFGCLRLAIMKPPPNESRLVGGWNNIDTAFLACGLARAAAVIIQFLSVAAVVNQAGILLATFGIYFILRQQIRDEKDIATAIKAMIVVAFICAASMVIEQLLLRNLFGTLIGGVDIVPLIRNGKTRAQGPFQHAILAGVFGATLLPLCLWLWTRGKSQMFAVFGMLSATAMTLMCASSTPVMAYGGVFVALCFWPIRRSMKAVRWTMVIVLVTLHLVMKAPVWFLIARVDVIGGSASWDRANLIDTCIRHFWDWWLIGTSDIGNWGWSMWDLSNQFVAIAETGGLFSLICFIAVISRSFGRLGTARRAVEGDRRAEWCMWLLCAAVYAHILAYFGVSYFDQTQVAWLVLLAIIAAATATPLAKVHSTSTQDASLSSSVTEQDSFEPSVWDSTVHHLESRG